MKEDVDTRGTGVPLVEDHGQDAHATFKKRYGGYLPHWTMEGATYAVTFRLADSLPQTVLQDWQLERKSIIETARETDRPLSPIEERRLRELHSEKVEQYLDAGRGACWMKNDAVAGIVADALRHFDGDRYELLAWCVMPNHVHAVVRPSKGYELPAILHSWKSFSAKAANKLLARQGEFWRPEYYDHLIRDEEDFWHCIGYVLSNPEMAGLTGWKWVGCGCGTGDPPVIDHGQDA